MEILEFLKNNYFVIIYGVTLFFSLIRYRRYFDSILKYLPILIAYTLLTEILGYYILEYEEFQIIYIEKYAFNNSIVYNIFDIIFFMYFFYIFWFAVENSNNKKIIQYGSIFFIIASLINLFFQKFWLFPQIYSIIAGSTVLVLCTLLYLKELNKKSKNISKQNNLLFWICIGLVVFYPFYPVFIIIGQYHYKLYSQLFKIPHHALIALMYIFFIIGFIKMHRMKPIQEED